MVENDFKTNDRRFYDQVAQKPTVPETRVPPGGIEPDQLDLSDEMFKALRQLSEIARCCLLWRVVDGTSYAEIAQSFDIPAGTAMSHVHRSKKLIRERLGASHKSSEGGLR